MSASSIPHSGRSYWRLWVATRDTCSNALDTPNIIAEEYKFPGSLDLRTDVVQGPDTLVCRVWIISRIVNETTKLCGQSKGNAHLDIQRRTARGELGRLGRHRRTPVAASIAMPDAASAQSSVPSPDAAQTAPAAPQATAASLGMPQSRGEPTFST